MDISYIPGVLKLNTCLLINYLGHVLDIRDILLEYAVYHDMFANGTKIEILIEDSNGIIEMLPIVGDETVLLEFGSLEDGTETSVSYFFKIYKIDNREKTKSRSESYILHGISTEVISNNRKKVSKAYTNLLASEVITEIYNRYLRPTASEYGNGILPVSLNIKETKEKKAWCFPTQKPLEAINYLCKEAEIKNSNKKGSNFVFYETHKNGTEWHFNTLDNLLQQEPIDKNTFSFAQQNISTQKSASTNSRARAAAATGPEFFTSIEIFADTKAYSFQKIENLRMIKQFDTLSNIQSGMYNNQIDIIDPLIKTFKTDVFLYDDDFGKIGHTQNQKMYTSNSLYKKQEANTIKHYMVSNFGDEYSKIDYMSSAINKDNQIKFPRVAHNFIKYDISSRQQFNNIILEVTIPGNVEIDIGDMVKIIIPQSSSFEEYSNRKNLLFDDEKFLIIALRHTYNKAQDKFFTVFECIKDTYTAGEVKEQASKNLDEI
jgi:hypothetical protein